MQISLFNAVETRQVVSSVNDPVNYGARPFNHERKPVSILNRREHVQEAWCSAYLEASSPAPKSPPASSGAYLIPSRFISKEVRK